MKIHRGIQFILFFYFFFQFPVFSQAQEGNHCSVRKSPYSLSMDSGKRVYMLHCVTCHQPDGTGIPNLNPPLNGKQVTGDKNKLIDIVIKGSASLVEINGISYNNPMPPNPAIKDREVADVLTYIRNSFGNKASIVRETEVKSMRSKMK
jgi:mono/diheme cytochrome c family protein